MIEAILIGLLAGVVAGLLGVGGGALFVPALTVFLGLTQLEAEATSLLAIVPVALVGALRQRENGNVHLEEGILVGVPAVAGVLLGTELQQRITTKAISLIFAAMLTIVAVDLLIPG